MRKPTAQSLKKKSDAVKKVIRYTFLINVVLFFIVLIGAYVWLVGK